MPKDVLGQSAAANVLGGAKKTTKKTSSAKTTKKATKKTASAKVTKKVAKKATAKKTTKKTATVDLAGAGDELLASLPEAAVADGSDRRVKLQPELYVRLQEIAQPFGDRRDPKRPREKLVSVGRLATVATDALLAACGEELQELAEAAGSRRVDVSDILTVGTHRDGAPHRDAPKVPWAKLSPECWARLTSLTSAARGVRDADGRQIITAEAITNEAVSRWLEANESAWQEAGRKLGGRR